MSHDDNDDQLARVQKITISLSTLFQNISISLASFLVRIEAPLINLSDRLTFIFTWKEEQNLNMPNENNI